MNHIRQKGVLKASARNRGGVGVSHNKNTAGCETVRMPAPSKVTLAMRQHIGAPCRPTVSVGDTVGVGQKIGDSDKYCSAPIHASVSGVVTAIGPLPLASGEIAEAVTIESDGEMRLFEGIAPPKADTKEEFLAAVRESGLVGLGGAGFPAHVKLNIPQGVEIDTLIINAAECEPYITVDYRECIENSWDILSGVRVVKDMLAIKNVVIAVEDNKPEAIAEMKKVADNFQDTGDEIKVMSLRSRYPQGAEKMMIRSVTGRKVPPGKLPSAVGCLVMNVASVSFLARYLKTGKPLVSRSLTVDGSAIAKPGNVRAPIGTLISELIDFCGGFKAEPYKIIAGGPMMGSAVIGTDFPTLKQYNAILAFAENTFRLKKERDCIRCGRCAFVCPLNLVPTALMDAAKAGNVPMIERLSADTCMECGSCAYVCPSGIPLVQYLRLAKAIKNKAGEEQCR